MDHHRSDLQFSIFAISLLHRSTFQNLHHHEIKLIKYYFTGVNTKDFEIFWYT